MLIAPSLLAADMLDMGKDADDVIAAGADWLHVDVMDGHLVPNLSFGLPFVAALKARVKVPLDVHIMISNPDVMAIEYVKAGASYLTFHPQASADPAQLIAKLRKAGPVLVGLALDPEIEVETLQPYLSLIDLVLLMAVKPGFGGQKFNEGTYAKLSALKAMPEAKKLRISVDGGVNDKNAAKLRQLGVDVLVAGSYVFGQSSRKAAIAALRS